MQHFDLDYLDDLVHVPSSVDWDKANDSPALAYFDTCFDPALGFSDGWSATLSEIIVPVSPPVVEQVEQFEYDFDLKIPQLNTEKRGLGLKLLLLFLNL